MDEILIEEKKYVSSKQAAKITGYAKDYIGQLCREGRVPARLVGRSWYVLESAIADHRFGNPEDGPVEETPVAPKATIAPTWTPPRYETVSDDTLPVVSRIKVVEEPVAAVVLEKDEPQQQIQDSWKEWFDRFNTKEEEVGAGKQEQEVVEEETKETEPEIGEEIEEEVSIPIHTYAPPPEELLPRSLAYTQPDEEEEEVVTVVRRSNSRIVSTLKIAGVAMALVAVALAVIGSGYVDQYIISNSQVRIISGVGLYNK